jgi:hypothetical protein
MKAKGGGMKFNSKWEIGALAEGRTSNFFFPTFIPHPSSFCLI